MNSKVANVIAIELGMLIVILAWLGFSRLPALKPPNVEQQESAANSFTTLAPMFSSRTPLLNGHHATTQPSYVANNAIDSGQAQPGAQPMPATAQVYIQEVATADPDGTALEDGLVATELPYYSEVGPEPALGPDYFAPAVEYVQPAEIVVFSNTRLFPNRRRRVLPYGARQMTINHSPLGQHPTNRIDRRRGEPRMHAGGVVTNGAAAGAVVPRRNNNARTTQARQGVAVTWHR